MSMRVAMTNEVRFRSHLGRFAALMEEGAYKTMEDAKDDGVRVAKSLAPTSWEYDPRTVKLKQSITGTATAGKAVWGSGARHALPQEYGSVPHLQTGRVTFWWENEGRMWEPG